tara:strand:- start:288 stop:2066 length:1779 start_codon:yes stop_codon:yes gene_type:complete
MISGAKLIYNKLLSHKVNDVFLYSGGAIMPLVDCFYKSKINYYINSNEHNGCNAAVGYAKSTGKTGVMVVTSGPGITNCVTSILDSTNDSTPLVVFSGQVPLNTIGTCAFQESPAVEITKPVTKWSYCVQNIDELSYVVDKAFYIANDGKKGAVHIDLPKCILNEETIMKGNYSDNTLAKIIKIESTYNNITTPILSNSQSKHYEDEYFNILCDIINKSESPIFYIGQGCNHASKELNDLVNKSNIPITTTMHAMGVYDERQPLSLKMCGMHGSYYANKSLQNADCIISIGARFDDRTTGLQSEYAPIAKKNKGIIHCNIEETEFNKTIQSNYQICMDSRDFINKIKDRIILKDRSKWLNQIDIWKNEHPFEFDNLDYQIKTQNVLVEINKQTQLINDLIITFGVGNHLMMGCQFIDWKNPNSILASGSLGVMGCSIGYAIGAQIANPGKTILSIDGDGSFNMTLNDLKTIREYNLPVKIAIINDDSLMMVKIWERLFFNENYTATDNNCNPDYVKLANSFGIEALYCDNRDDLSATVETFLNYNGPILCEFKVLGEECLPLVGPGKALDDMILFKDYKQTKPDFNNEMAPN